MMAAVPPATNPLADDLAHILAHTDGSVWEALRGQNIFVTGGTGFFGRWLLESFASANRHMELGARIVVLSRNPDAFAKAAPHLSSSSGITLVAGDVRTFSAASVAEQLGPSAPSNYHFVIHAATDASAKLNAENPLLMSDTIVQGTRAALEFAVATAARRFLLTSSGAVYGNQPSEVTHVPEEYNGAPQCTDPRAAYGESKRLAELLCACFGKQFGLEPLIARCFAFVGPFLPLDAHFAIGNFIRDAMNGCPPEVKGDGTPFRSYLYAADLVIWIWTILTRGQPLRPYNVGSEDDRSIRQIAEAVAAVSQISSVLVHRDPVAGIPPERYVPSCVRARDELGLHAWIDLPAGIRRTIAHAQRSNTSAG